MSLQLNGIEILPTKIYKIEYLFKGNIFFMAYIPQSEYRVWNDDGSSHLKFRARINENTIVPIDTWNIMEVDSSNILQIEDARGGYSHWLHQKYGLKW